jgi:hypothetical protein
MYFIVRKGSALYDKFQKLREDMKSAHAAAKKLAKELGAEAIRGSSLGLAGGISSFVFPEGTPKPKNWKRIIYGDWEYFPSKFKANAELLARIEALPVVKEKELNDIVAYNWRKCAGNRISFHPEVHFLSDSVLVQTHSEIYPSYKPVAGMEEILESEFLKLKNA